MTDQQTQAATQTITAEAAEDLHQKINEFSELLKQPKSPRDIQFDDATMDRVERMANLMASGRSSIPKHLHDSPGDCAAIVMMAMRIKCDPYALAQRTYFVNGKMGVEAPAVIAILNSSPDLKDRLQFEWFGDWKGCNGKTDKSPDKGVRVSATLTGESAPRVLELSMAEVGDVRNSPLWPANPKQQIGYRAANYWARLHAPDATLGIRSLDEVLDEVVTADPALKHQRRTTTAADLLSRGAVQAQEAPSNPHAATIKVLEETARTGGYEAAKKAWKKLPDGIRVQIGDAERDRIAQLGKDADDARARAAATPDPETGEIKGQDSAEFEEAVKIASNGESAALTVDEARSALGADSAGYQRVVALYQEKWGKSKT